MHLKCLFKKLNKRLLSVALAAVVLVATAVALCINFVKSMEYVVYVDGVAVCSVKDEAVLDQAIEMLEVMYGQLGAEGELVIDAEVRRSHTSLNEMNASDLANALYGESINDYVRAYTVSLKDVEAGTVYTYEEAQQIVNTFTEHISNKVLSSGNGEGNVVLSTDFVISSVICRRDKVSNAEYICRLMINGGDYEGSTVVPSEDRVVANGSMDFLYADRNNAFGMLKNEEETVLPDLDFIFNIGSLNAAVDVKTYVVEKYSEVINFKTIYVETDELYVGQTKVGSKGENGIAENVYEIAYVSGEVVSKTLVSSNVVCAAVDRIEYIGTKEPPSTDPTGTFIWPIQQKFVITSYFGDSGSSRPSFSQEAHRALDIAGVPRGTDVVAADGGEVVFTGTSGTYGLLVRIRHEDGVETYYAHLNKIDVKVGDKVYKGQRIGGVGDTGRVTGVHLHFEVRFNKAPVDPLKYLPKAQPGR